jgi:hypothetical protein
MSGIARRFDTSGEVTRFPNGEERILQVLVAPVGLATFEPGWRWTNDVRPIVGRDRCPRLHVGYLLSGRLHVEFPDGSTMDIHAGDLVEIPPDHDAWTVGTEAAVLLDWPPDDPATTQPSRRDAAATVPLTMGCAPRSQVTDSSRSSVLLSRTAFTARRRCRSTAPATPPTWTITNAGTIDLTGPDGSCSGASPTVHRRRSPTSVATR